MAQDDTDRVDTWLDLPPSAQQTRWALAVTAIVLVGFVAVIPIARQPMVELNAFFPSLDAIVFVSDLVTAALLYAQFSISRSRALLALATGYLFTALIVIPHALTFAGAFTATGLLGANIQTGSWLFIFWHIGFAAALLAYALLREERIPRTFPARAACPRSDGAWQGSSPWCVSRPGSQLPARRCCRRSSWTSAASARSWSIRFRSRS